MKGKFCAKTDFGTVNRRYGNAGEIAVESMTAGVAVTAFEQVDSSDGRKQGNVHQYNVYLTSGVERRGANAKLLLVLTVDVATGTLLHKEVI